ncbi:uncharacterized protein SPAPADRAFT_57752 [Spathaspora passalidarum NRRL Y-27907]|uniref:Transcription activator GCR1-like domain-containing protein n=1 Tax=Spathaspora passalidarum (strain NRRL Y-27907 / 11-Y1) TaxID=619300 RepID=G3ADX1_SPAPN|nr:uncharacterized protein SPAPADRAFT_57752 [Spathaspora passalidarum NRRL Y-27907]EGW34695.1 hypothetical protein SPAPADRAFT_57752 [Spathaspora passalidarum NRRL Y-27907]
MLPLPNLLGEGNAPSNKPGSVAVQYMSTIPPSELRHTNQSRTSFFGDDDIDHNIDELSGDNGGNTNAAGTGSGGTTAGTAGSDSTTGTAAVTTVSAPGEPNDDTSSSNGDDKPSKKRKSDESSKANLSLDIPKYRLERSLKSISDIWKEYEYGLNDKPPLKLLEIKYGTKWRNDTESRTFLRRKKIYDAIENGKAKGYTEDQVIRELEEYRSYDRNGTIKKKPLSWLNANMPDKYDS